MKVADGGLKTDHDYCYYEISANNKAVKNITDIKNGVRIFVNIKQASQMNVYAYGGKRLTATEWVSY